MARDVFEFMLGTKYCLPDEGAPIDAWLKPPGYEERGVIILRERYTHISAL